MYYIFTKSKEELLLETGKAFGEACEHKNVTEKVFKYLLSGIKETFVRCNDCDYTVFNSRQTYNLDEEKET